MIIGSTRNQYLAGILLNSQSINRGIIMGWSSSTLLLLQSKETPLPCGPLMLEQLSWVVAIVFLGGLVGTFLFGAIVDRIGRKMSLILSTILGIISWLFILFAQNENYLIVGRFFGGVGNSGAVGVLPIYISEIAESRVRGKLQSISFLAGYIGIMLAFTLGDYVSFYTSTIIYTLFPIIFLITILFLPETPYFLMQRNQMNQAEKSLAFFRSTSKKYKDLSSEYIRELQYLKEQNDENTENNKQNLNQGIDWKDFVTPNARRALLIGVGLMAVNQFSGSLVILNYASTIFKDYGTLDPNKSSLIVSAVHLIGSTLSLVLIERCGRKPLLVISTLGSAIGLTVMGTYIYFRSMNNAVDYNADYSFVLLSSFAFVLFITPLGVAALPFLIIFEIMPEKIRGVGTAFCLALFWILSYLTSNFYYAFTQIIGTYGCMFIFAGCSYIGTAFIMKFLIETKGKTLQEIQTLLS